MPALRIPISRCQTALLNAAPHVAAPQVLVSALSAVGSHGDAANSMNCASISGCAGTISARAQLPSRSCTHSIGAQNGQFGHRRVTRCPSPSAAKLAASTAALCDCPWWLTRTAGMNRGRERCSSGRSPNSIEGKTKGHANGSLRLTLLTPFLEPRSARRVSLGRGACLALDARLLPLRPRQPCALPYD